jgi:hypothetical protein
MPVRVFLIVKNRRLWYKFIMITERLANSADDDAYYVALDRLVDTKGYSYHDARLELGEVPSERIEALVVAPHPIGKVVTHRIVRRSPRPRSGHGPQFGEEEGVGYPDGKPPYYQPYVPLSAQQQETNRNGAAAVRAELKRRREEAEQAKDGHEPPSDI